MPEIRDFAPGMVWFEDPERILELMARQCSATRCAYQTIHKFGLKGNDVKVRVRQFYGERLNGRYISDAVSLTKSVTADHAIFGGKRAMQKRSEGKITNEEWKARRNSQLYSRGERSHDGNPNIRIVGNELWINDPDARGGWVKGKLFIPDKFTVDKTCYDARLIHRPDGKFSVIFTWAKECHLVETVPGAIGIDINPSGVAVSEVDWDGNLMFQTFLSAERIQFARADKRRNDVCHLAIEIVDIAECAMKPIIIEDLKFDDRKKGEKGRNSKRSNRMKSNFLFRQIINAVERCAIKRGIPVSRVNPAFTSDLGHLKYEKMYSLSPHAAAAMVIARRGIGIVERQTFSAVSEPKPKGKGKQLNLEGKDCDPVILSPKAWEWLRKKFLRPRTPSSQDRQDPDPREIEWEMAPRRGTEGNASQAEVRASGGIVTNTRSVTSSAEPSCPVVVDPRKGIDLIL